MLPLLARVKCRQRYSLNKQFDAAQNLFLGIQISERKWAISKYNETAQTVALCIPVSVAVHHYTEFTFSKILCTVQNHFTKHELCLIFRGTVIFNWMAWNTMKMSILHIMFSFQTESPSPTKSGASSVSPPQGSSPEALSPAATSPSEEVAPSAITSEANGTQG